MPRTVTPTISVADVEQEIVVGTRRLAFSPPIEAAFERDCAAARLRMMTATVSVALLLYDLFLFADWVTIPDMFWTMAVARLGIFTPALVLVLLASRRGPSTFVAESMATGVGILGVFLPMAAMVMSESPYRLNYQYGSLLIMMFCTVVYRLRFRFAIVALAGMLVIQLTAVEWSGAFDAPTYLGIVLFFSTASVLLAFTTYFLEHAERRSFLFSLRGELLREQIEAGARTDPLTGLFNRRRLGEVTGEVWEVARRAPRQVAAILLDIDHFKSFNDSRGHLEGDACLRAVSDRIAAVARERNGLAVRFGGEEMLVLLPDTGIADAARTAETIRREIEAAAIPHPAIGGVVTASLGFAGVIAPEATVGELIAAADTALYAAKRGGRNRVGLAAALPDTVPDADRAAA